MQTQILKTVDPTLQNAVPFWLGLIRDGADTRNLKADYKTLIVSIFPYYCAEASEGNAAMFATQFDYHTKIKEILAPDLSELEAKYPEDIFHLYVDSSPFNEVAAAMEAGLGARGNNNLLQHPEYGSYVYIACIGTTVAPENFGAVRSVRKYCADCGLCVKACPGKALGEHFERTSCASYISQQKSALDEKQTEILIKSRSIYGCDICQKVCPANAEAKRGMAVFCDDVNPVYTATQLSKQIKGRAPEWRGQAVLRRNLSILGRSGKE